MNEIQDRLEEIRKSQNDQSNKLELILQEMSYIKRDLKDVKEDVDKHDKILSGNGETGMVAKVNTLWDFTHKKIKWLFGLVTSLIVGLAVAYFEGWLE